MPIPAGAPATDTPLIIPGGIPAVGHRCLPQTQNADLSGEPGGVWAEFNREYHDLDREFDGTWDQR